MPRSKSSGRLQKQPKASALKADAEIATSLTGERDTMDAAEIDDGAGRADAPIQTGKVIAQVKGESELLKLPEEIKQRIWELAVTVDEPITPIQVKRRSNKFTWTKPTISQSKEANPKPQLTMVQLSKVSKAVYAEVVRTYLFYKVNTFKFERTDEAISYLVAVTPNRLQAIRSLKIPFFVSPHRGYEKPAELYNIVRACSGLQFLQLTFVPGWGSLTNDLVHLTAHKELFLAIRGLKELTLVSPKVGYWFGGASLTTVTAFVNYLDPILRDEMKKPRDGTYSTALFRKAQKIANLDIDGEGRLGEDRKPGMVSSRTRQQIRGLTELSAEGTMPERSIPKYDLNGDFTWHIASIVSSRATEFGNDAYGVDFLVKYSKTRWGEAVGETWESVAALNSVESRSWIVRYYQQTPTGYGKELVLDLWKLDGPGNGEEGEKDDRKKARIAASLREVVRKDTARVRAIEEAKARAAAAEKAAKESKTRKKKAVKAKKVAGKRIAK